MVICFELELQFEGSEVEVILLVDDDLSGIEASVGLSLLVQTVHQNLYFSYQSDAFFFGGRLMMQVVMKGLEALFLQRDLSFDDIVVELLTLL